MALGNNPSQTDVIKAIRDLESGSGGGGVQSVTTGSTNGTISVDGTDVAVYGLGSNAFNSTTIPSTTGSVISGSTSALTSGGAYDSLVNKLYRTTQTITIFNNTSESTPLKLRSGNSYAYIGFKDANGTDKGALGVDNNGNPVFNDGSDHKLAYISNIPGGGTTASAVGTSASGGSASTYSKSDHVHNITSSTITSALGYTPNKTIGVTTNSSSGQAATSGYNRIRLTNVGDKALVFHKQYSTTASGTFSGSAFSTVLLAWVEQASTGDTQSQRTTLQSVTTSGWSIAGGYKHWICVIGLV